MTDLDTPVWFITGCSTGFGRDLAAAVLARGYRAVVTARNVNQLAAVVDGHEERALALTLDVTDRDQAEAAVKAAIARFGRIDVLVNNAGIGYFAAIEESDEAEVRQMFEVNVFGLSRMIHLVLPGMRTQRSGTIVNISSIGGIRAFPAVGYYNGTKFAVEGISEALSQEVAPLGIKVLIVEPSGFRTDWAGRSANETQHPIADYDATAGRNKGTIRGYSGAQPRGGGDHQGRRGEEPAAAPAAGQGGPGRGARQDRDAAEGFRRLGRGDGRGRLPRGRGLNSARLRNRQGVWPLRLLKDSGATA